MLIIMYFVYLIINNVNEIIYIFFYWYKFNVDVNTNLIHILLNQIVLFLLGIFLGF